jgi:uncharacterized protein YqeY
VIGAPRGVPEKSFAQRAPGWLAHRVRARLRQDLTAAMKARDRTAVSALRSALAAIDNAEAPTTVGLQPRGADSEHVAGSSVGVGAAEVGRRVLSEDDVCALVQAQIAERMAAAEGYDTLGRAEDANRLRAEADVLRRHLNP